MVRSEHNPSAPPSRDRRVFALLVVVAIALGLASRRYGGALPGFVAEYAGDTLWATMVFFLLAFAFPAKRTAALASATLVIAFVVELSQLYHAPWIDVVRSTRFGALALGSGFLWSDLVCYTVGVGLGVLVERVLVRSRRHQAGTPKV